MVGEPLPKLSTRLAAGRKKEVRQTAQKGGVLWPVQRRLAEDEGVLLRDLGFELRKRLMVVYGKRDKMQHQNTRQ